MVNAPQTSSATFVGPTGDDGSADAPWIRDGPGTAPAVADDAIVSGWALRCCVYGAADLPWIRDGPGTAAAADVDGESNRFGCIFCAAALYTCPADSIVMRLGSVEFFMPRCGMIDRFDVAVGAFVAVAVLVLPKFDGACWGGRSFSNMLGSK